MKKDDKCYFCDELGIETKRICVDAEPDEFNETMLGIYSEVLLCKEHLQEYESFTYLRKLLEIIEQEGVFEPQE